MDDADITSSAVEGLSSVSADDPDKNCSSAGVRISKPLDDAVNTNGTVSSVRVDDAGESCAPTEEQPCVPMDDDETAKDKSSVTVNDVKARDKSSLHIDGVETEGNQVSLPRSDGQSSLALEMHSYFPRNDVETTGDQSSSPRNDVETMGDQSSSPRNDVETTGHQSSSPRNDVEATGDRSSSPRNDVETTGDKYSSNLGDGVETTGNQSSVPMDGVETTGSEAAVPIDGVDTTGSEAAVPMDVETTESQAVIPMDIVETAGNQDTVPGNDGETSSLTSEMQFSVDGQKTDSSVLEQVPVSLLGDRSLAPADDDQITRSQSEEKSCTATQIEPGTKENLMDQSVMCTTPLANPSLTMESGLRKKDHVMVPLREFIDLAGQHIANGTPTKRLKAMPHQSNAAQVEHVTKRVADIVLILAGLGLIRSGQEPTEVERRLQAEAYGYLGYLVQKFAPKDLILLESINGLIEDLALRRSDECEVKTFAQILESFRPPPIQAVPAEVQKSSDKRDFQRPSTSGISNDWETQKTALSAEGQVKTDSLEAQASHDEQLSPAWSTAKVNEAKLDLQPRHIMQTIHDIVQANYPPDFKLQPAYPKSFMNAPVPCEMCKLVIRETANVLACDSCERVFHLRCLQQNHLLKGIPKGDWYCQKCTANPVNSQEKRKYGRVKAGFTFPEKRTGTSNATPGKNVQGSTKAEISKKMDGSANMATKNITHDTQAMHTGKVPAEIDGDAQDTSPKLVKPVINGNTGSVPVCVAQFNSQPTTIQTPEKGTKCGPEDDVDREPKDRLSPTKPAETIGGLKQDDPNRLVKDTERLQIEWVGDELQTQDEKVFYSSCRVGGITYKLQDCALFRPETPNVPPYIARLQALWEDKKTGSKWVRVNWCYYPADLAMIAGRPPNPEEHEIYESNHGDNNLVGTIQGECLVLRSEGYQKEMQRRQEVLKSGNTTEGLIPIFLCRWFYDAPSSTFKPETDGS